LIKMNVPFFPWNVTYIPCLHLYIYNETFSFTRHR